MKKNDKASIVDYFDQVREGSVRKDIERRRAITAYKAMITSRRNNLALAGKEKNKKNK